MSRARSFARRAAVTDAHVRADRFGSIFFTPFFRDFFETSTIVFLGGDIGFAFSAIQAAVSSDLDHVSSTINIRNGMILKRDRNPCQDGWEFIGSPHRFSLD
jgi:hypothetical protein